MAHYHFAELIHHQAEKYGSQTVMKYRNNQTSKWHKISWKEFSEKIMLTAKAMAEFGMKEHENIGIYSQNMPQYLYTDFGVYANRAVLVPMYATSSPVQIEYIINDAEIKSLFVGEQLQYNNAFKIQKDSKTLKRIIVFDSAVKLSPEDKTSVFFDDFLRLGDNGDAETIVKVRMRKASVEDLATIIYTSGTTGESKGVMLHHSNFIEAMRIHEIRLPMVNDKDTSMSFLPLTHIFEKAWVYYCLQQGVTIAINQDPQMIQQTLVEIHPTLMCNVPRFWEKVYVGVHEKIDSFPSFLQKLSKRAIRIGNKYHFEYRNKGIKAPFGLELSFKIYNATIFKAVKKVLGIEKGRLFPVAGAPLSDTVNAFLQSMDIPIVYGYGLSETTATVSFCPMQGFILGSIGEIMPDVQVKIDEATNEILIKGKIVTAGYYKKPDETAKVMTEDGFFRTGDAGRLEGDVLFFTERIKDLYKTSNGKYIAPQAIEMAMGSDKYIGQIAVIGDDRKFVGALIVPNFLLLEEYAKQKGIDFEERADLVQDPQIIRLIESRVEKRQNDMASYEKIKRFVLLSEPFTMEGRELTDTLKLRRPVILQKYTSQIEKMYKE